MVRADPVRPGLLFVGTETGVFVTFDDGEHWQLLRNNLPVVPVYDLKIKDSDLVAGTHGRSFWILDDLTPLRRMASEATGAAARLFPPRPTNRTRLNWSVNMFADKGKNYMLGLGGNACYYQDETPEGETVRRYLDAGQNPPPGVIVYYLLAEAPGEPVALTFLDADGREIKTFTSKPEESEEAGGAQASPKADRYLTARPGLNRFVWDMHYPDAEKVEEREKDPSSLFGTKEKSGNGPLAPPGAYGVRLTAGGRTRTESFEILKDPRVEATAEDFQAQFELWTRIRDKLSETNRAINRTRRLQEQLAEWSRRAVRVSQGDPEGSSPVSEKAKTLGEQLDSIEKALIQTKDKTPFDRLRHPNPPERQTGGPGGRGRHCRCRPAQAGLRRIRPRLRPDRRSDRPAAGACARARRHPSTNWSATRDCRPWKSRPHFSPGGCTLEKSAGVRVMFIRAHAVPCGSFQEKRAIVDEDEPRMDTNKHK